MVMSRVRDQRVDYGVLEAIEVECIACLYGFDQGSRYAWIYLNDVFMTSN